MRDFGILGISDYLLGGLQPPALALGPTSFQRYIQSNTVYERGKFGFYGPFSFVDMKAQILTFLTVAAPSSVMSTAKFSKSGPENRCRSYALFDVLR